MCIFSTGRCEIDEVLLAININGARHTDRRGIEFKAEREGDYQYSMFQGRNLISFDRTIGNILKRTKNCIMKYRIH